MITLKENEVLVRTIRKHWFVLFGELVGLAGIYLVPFVLYALLKGAEVPLGATTTVPLSLSGTTAVFIGTLWTLVIWMKVAGVWTDYYLDIWIVTNKRVIDIEQRGFFHRETSTLPIERVQDVTVRVRGIIATFLDFGEVHVQTAGAAREFVIHGVPRPRKVKEVILYEHQRARPRPASDSV